jgi:hypothetical protein
MLMCVCDVHMLMCVCVCGRGAGVHVCVYGHIPQVIKVRHGDITSDQEM